MLFNMSICVHIVLHLKQVNEVYLPPQPSFLKILFLLLCMCVGGGFMSHSTRAAGRGQLCKVHSFLLLSCELRRLNLGVELWLPPFHGKFLSALSRLTSPPHLSFIYNENIQTSDIISQGYVTYDISFNIYEIRYSKYEWHRENISVSGFFYLRECSPVQCILLEVTGLSSLRS